MPSAERSLPTAMALLPRSRRKRWRRCSATWNACSPLRATFRAGRRGGHQRVGELADPAFDQQAPGQAQQVIGRDGPQPGLAKATGGLAVCLAEEAVETGGVAFEQLAYRGRLRSCQKACSASGWLSQA